MYLAKELGMTLGQLRREMTREEVLLWHAFFQLQHDQQQEAMKIYLCLLLVRLKQPMLYMTF